MKVKDRIQLTTDINAVLFASHKAGQQGVIRKTAPWGGLFMLRMDDGRTQFAHRHEITPAPAKPATTGREFAKNHGNDSSTWTPADFETALNLAESDVQPAWLRIKKKPTQPSTDLTPAA